MNILSILLALACSSATLLPVSATDKVTTYAAPQGASLNDSFDVRIRPPGGEWRDVATYRLKVVEVIGADYSYQDTSMAYFDFSGSVEVEIRSRREVDLLRVRPLSFGIEPTVRGNVIRFTLDRPRNLSVEVNGDIFDNLQLFANPLETDRPDPGDPDVIYFGPGIHTLGEGPRHRTLLVPSGKTVYIAGGAIVRGRIVCHRVKNVRVLGRGIVEQGDRKGDGVCFEHSRNVSVEGIFTPQCFTGGSNGVRITNVKCISYLGNGDGMNVISGTDVVIDGVFNRNSDDCVTVYGTRGDYVGDSRNITVRNSTLWADVAHPILVGTHGNTPDPETLENLTFRNLDVLDHKEAQLDYQGCLALNAGDSNLIRNVLFENIRVEDFRQGQLLNLRVFHNRKYCTSPGRGIENVIFRDVSYTGRNAEQSIIAGYDGERPIRDIDFENLVINGTKITDDMEKPGWFKTSDMAGIFVGEHVEDVSFQ